MNIAGHDFRRALRVWEKRLKPEVIFEKVCQERSRAVAAYVRVAVLALGLLLWLTSNRDQLVLKIAFLDLAIPASYVNAVEAILLVGVIMHFINYLTLNEFVRVASNRLFQFDSPWVLSVPFDGGDAWNIGTMGQFRFFQSSSAHRSIMHLYALVLNLPALILLGMGYLMVVLNGWNSLAKEGLLSISGLFTMLAWIFLIQGLFMIVVMFVRFTFYKNAGFIRWLVLNRLYRRIGRRHPRASAWVNSN